MASATKGSSNELTVTMLGVELYARCWDEAGNESSTDKEAIKEATPPEGAAGISISR